MDEFWRCESCGSKVRATSPRCFRCGSPRPAEERAAARPAAAAAPAIDDEAGAALAGAASSGRGYLPVGTLATTLSAIIVALLLIDIVRFWAGTMLHGLDGHTSAILPNAAGVLTPIWDLTRVVEPVVGVMALTIWLFFLAVSISNAPALGAGTPAATWFDLIVDWLMPIRNLHRPRAAIADLYQRLAVPGATGTKIVGYWWTCVLAWFLLNYLPVFLSALEILIAVGVAIFIFFASALTGVAMFVETQPHWTWATSPIEMIEIVLAVAVAGPISFFGGSSALLPSFTVPSFGHSLVGIGIIDAAIQTLESLGLINEILFAAMLILMLRIVVELAERQRIRAGWIESPSTAAPVAAHQ